METIDEIFLALSWLHDCMVRLASGQDEVVKVEVAKVAEGDQAPDFTMTGIDGNDLKLSDLTAQGQNVVLMFDRAHW